MTTKQEIINLLMTNDRAVGRALIVLNERQTADERAVEGTRWNNGQGFTPADAHMGTSMANFFVRFNRLSDKQVAYWRKPNCKGTPRIAKYAGQLLEIAQAKAAKAVLKMTERAELESELTRLELDYADLEDSDDFPKLEMIQDRMAVLREQLDRVG